MKLFRLTVSSTLIFVLCSCLTAEAEKTPDELAVGAAIVSDKPEGLLAAAGVYQSQGNLNQAVAILRQYLHKYPARRDTGRMREYVRYLENQQKILPKGQSASSRIVRGNKKLSMWLAQRMPLRVYVIPANGNLVESREAVRQACSTWSILSQRRVRFREVSDPRHADIEISFAKDTRQFKRSFAAGETRWSLESDKLKAHICLLTIMNGAPLSKSGLSWLCLHELGHAIGLQHSPHPEDIMFISMPENNVWKRPSPRDRRSLAALYAKTM